MTWLDSKVRNFYKSSLFVLVSALLVLSTLAPLAKVFADAADPVPASTIAGIVPNPDGSLTVTVQGQWQWTTHTSDCNLDRFGVGAAVDWNDPNQPGNVVDTLNGVTVDVGAAAANAYNPADNLVRYWDNPAGTINPATGLPYAGTTYCGMYNPAVDYNTGFWGHKAPLLTHTYAAGTNTINPCVVTYDIHSTTGNNTFPRVPNPDHLVAGGDHHNGDNSIESNKNTPLGNGCFTTTFQNIFVIKHVINNNGGTKSAGDFTINATGNNPSPSTFQGSEAGTLVQIGTGSYSVDEVADPGYTKTLSAGCSGTVNAGETKICTITNDDVPQPTLKLTKSVTNNNGGTKTPADWTLTATGSGGFSDTGDSTTFHTVNAGTSYALSESTVPGYGQVGNWSCNGGNQNGNNITLSSGQNVTCSVTNDDIAPSLTLNKIVSNTHGGTATESQWTLTATGTGQSPTNLSGPGAPGNADVVSGSNFKADTYTLGESAGPNGYAHSNFSCTNGVTVTNSQITLANGQTTVCSITNSDIAPHLTVNKMVINNYGNPASPNSFPLFVDGNPVANGQKNESTAGNHTITETQQPGYTFSGVSQDCVFQNNMISISLGLADDKSCTVINTAIQPKLTVIKHVINDNSGTKSADDFTMHVTATNPTSNDFAGDENGTTIGLNEGPYSVDELSHVGYTETKSADCTGTISIGQEKICTITNNDIPNPAIHVVKSGPDTAHEGDVVTYTYHVTNVGDTQSLSGITVIDDLAGTASYQSGDTNTNGLLDKSEVWVFTKQYTIPTPQVGDVFNTVEACGHYNDTKVCDTDDHNLDVLHPNIHVEKFGPSSAFAGDTVTYTFLVTNPGDTPLSGLTVNDNVAGVGTYVSGDTHNIGNLDTDETWVYTKQYTIPTSQTTDVVNTVTACGHDSGNVQVCDTDDHTLVVLHPSIHVVKSGPSNASAGSTVTYTFTVTNDGNIPLSQVTVNDNLAGTGTYQSGDTNSNQMLDLNETWTYTAQYTIPAGQTASVNNTVTACGEPIRELEIESLQVLQVQPVCDTDTHTLVIPKVLAATTPPPTVLVNTGQNALGSLFAGLAILGLAGATTFAARPKKVTAKASRK